MFMHSSPWMCQLWERSILSVGWLQRTYMRESSLSTTYSIQAVSHLVGTITLRVRVSDIGHPMTLTCKSQSSPNYSFTQCINPRGWHSYTLTRWSVGHVWQDKHQSVRFFVFIRQYAHTCLCMKRQDLGQYPTELLMTWLVCKVGLYYSSASINQLLNTKNSLLHLLSRKATLKCEILFKSVFFTNLFTWNCSKKC